jgi:hypothetical protein
MLDKYSKIQSLIDEQKKKNQKLLECFETVLNFLPKMEIDFGKVGNEVIKIKIQDKSSVKFVVLQNQEKIKKEFKKYYSDILIII